MSRRLGLPVAVTCDAEGAPITLRLPDTRQSLPVLDRADHWREWFGAIDGEPERDVWQVETAQGVCELHCLRMPWPEQEPAFSHWLLYRWED